MSQHATPSAGQNRQQVGVRIQAAPTESTKANTTGSTILPQPRGRNWQRKPSVSEVLFEYVGANDVCARQDQLRRAVGTRNVEKQTRDQPDSAEGRRNREALENRALAKAVQVDDTTKLRKFRKKEAKDLRDRIEQYVVRSQQAKVSGTRAPSRSPGHSRSPTSRDPTEEATRDGIYEGHW